MIVINCTGSDTLELDELADFQGALKQRSAADINKIIKSIKKHGFSFPFFVWAHDDINHVLDGHGRLAALKKMQADGEEIPALPCVYVEAENEAEAKEKLLKLNSQYGHMTAESVADFLDGMEIELDDLALPDGVLDLSGIAAPEEETEGDDDAPDVDEDGEPDSQPGEMYELGNSILLCGDSTNPEDVARLMGGEKIKLTFTDPPYELGTQGGGILKTANSMKQIEDNEVNHFDPKNLKLYSETNIYFHNKPLIKKYIELAEENGAPYDLAFYKKQNTVPNYKGHLMTDCEYIAIIGKQDPNKGLAKELYSKCYIGKKDSDNKLSYSKPVELCEKYLKLYAEDAVLDLFGGSGSTLIAAEKLGLKCKMIEHNPRMCDVIRKRWTKWAQENGRKVGSGGLE